MTDNTTADLRIDIISDIVCPWCIIGYKQLERSLALTAVVADIHWHPFELNPNMTREGENLREHLAGKYGTTPEDSRKARARLTTLGAELGFEFNYADDMRVCNTFRAHQLLHWAGLHGRQHALKMALFGAFFSRRQDVSDVEVLADIAASIDLEHATALAVLEDGRFAEAVREEEALWTSRGITAVPAMVFDQRDLVTGAQGVESYTRILRQLAEGRAA